VYPDCLASEIDQSEKLITRWLSSRSAAAGPALTIERKKGKAEPKEEGESDAKKRSSQYKTARLGPLSFLTAQRRTSLYLYIFLLAPFPGGTATTTAAAGIAPVPRRYIGLRRHFVFGRGSGTERIAWLLLLPPYAGTGLVRRVIGVRRGHTELTENEREQ
jgi:hypothetical protein